MAKSELLNVFLNQNYVGQLKLAPSGAMSFSYDKSWLNNSKAIPISTSLGLNRQKYKGTELYNYFDNLLPDGKEIRQHLAKNMGAKSDRPFDLLSSIGSDCVGALRFLPENKQPESDKFTAKNISSQGIANVLKNLKSFPLGLNRDQDFRISIAGSQEKAAFLYHDSTWKIPLGATPTTHIFKNPMGILQNGIDLSTSVENEWLCLQICKHLGLNVNNAEIKQFSGHKCLVLTRFDRAWKGDTKIIRIPQEDFCQAMGIASHMKYESDHRKGRGPRPGIKDCLNLLNGSDERSQDRLDFFKAQIIFWLLAAIDGHGKNFSLFLTSSGFKMTPFYDILSAYPALSSKKLRQNHAKLAMAIGKNRHYRLKEILPRHFYQSAKSYGIPKVKVDVIFSEILRSSKTIEGKIKLPHKFPGEIYEAIMVGFQDKVKQIFI